MTQAGAEAMRQEFRSFLKRTLPPGIKGLIHRARAAIAQPPIDDIALAHYRVDRDENARPRLTFVVPLLVKGSDFGGTATGIEIACHLYLALTSKREWDLRIIVTDVVSETDVSTVVTRAAKAGVTIEPEQIQLVSSTTSTITVRVQEIFVAYNWWVALNFAAVRDRQAALFATPPQPLVWLMQDYEPAFMPFSSAHLLARAAYDTTAPLWGVINSSNLASYLEAVGHRPARRFVFEPVIVDALRPFLDRVASSARAPRMLVYGRPSIDRNCFPALVRGLRRWVRDYPEFAEWEVISAGVPHGPVDLGSGRTLTSVGKLALEDYAEMLLSCSVGVSLMASPHPSYPPLEMAHFGLRTVTNGYFCKNLESFHPNILEARSIAEHDLAAAIAEACRRSAAPPALDRNAEYLRTDAYPFMSELAQGLDQALAQAGGPR